MRWGLITGLSQRLPWQAAVLLSAALFAWGHSWFKLPHTLLTGLVLGYLCWYTGSVMYGIVVHILVNGVPDGFFIRHLHPHMFRHTFVSILMSNPDIGVATVAAEAGHAQPSTTLMIYTQQYKKRQESIRNQLSRELYGA